MRQVLLTSVLILFFSAGSFGNLYSNGGPSGGSAISRTGNITLKKIEGVEVIAEELFIKPVGNDVTVSVTYQILCSTEGLDVDYGFPFFTSKDGEDFQDIYLPLNDPENRSIRYFIMDFNGNNIPQKEFVDEKDSGEVKWYLSRLKLKKGINTIRIRYRVESNYIDWSTSKSPYTSFDKRKFRYNFRPAAGWGNGVVKKLTISVDATDVITRRGEIQVGGLAGFTRNQGEYRLELKHVNFATLNDLTLQYTVDKYFGALEKQIQPGQNQSKDRTLSVTASSSLEGAYTIDQVFDGNYNTAWAEGVAGQGVGEWIDIVFKNGAGVVAISVANGYMKNRAIFLKNSRIRSMKCEALGRYLDGPEKGKQFSFSKNVSLRTISPDMIPEDKWVFRGDGIWTGYTDAIITPEDVVGVYELVRVRLTITDIYPGDKYEDTCITELFLY